MKIFRKLFSKKDPTEKKIEANEKALKKRNVKRGVAATLGVGLSAHAGKVTGDIAKGVAENSVYNKAARKAIHALAETAEKIANKARTQKLTEREAEFMSALSKKISKASPQEINDSIYKMAKNNRAVRASAEKAGKRAKIGVGLAVGGALAAKTIANAIRLSKDDKKRTEGKNNKLKEESKNFSRLGEVSKKVAKTGIKAGKKYIKDFDLNDYNNLKSVKDSYVAAKKNNDNKPENNLEKDKLFSGREKVSKENLKEAKKSGVIQKDSDGNWRIISLKAGEYWDAKYETREKAEAALAAYHANRH